MNFVFYGFIALILVLGVVLYFSQHFPFKKITSPPCREMFTSFRFLCPFFSFLIAFSGKNAECRRDWGHPLSLRTRENISCPTIKGHGSCRCFSRCLPSGCRTLPCGSKFWRFQYEEPCQVLCLLCTVSGSHTLSPLLQWGNQVTVLGGVSLIALCPFCVIFLYTYF